jgi:hypothetical protein
MVFFLVWDSQGRGEISRLPQRLRKQWGLKWFVFRAQFKGRKKGLLDLEHDSQSRK